MKNNLITLEVLEKDRADKYIAKHTTFSRSFVQKLIKEEKVFLNDKIAKSNNIVEISDIIKIKNYEDKRTIISVEPVKRDLDIIFQNNDFAVVYKENNLVVHPSQTTKDITLVNILKYYFKELSNKNGKLRPGIVHRLDKDTAGLLLIAKNNETHKKLQQGIQQGDIERIYYALVDGNIKEDTGIIEGNISRSKKDRKKMALNLEGRFSKTSFKVIKRYKVYTLLECSLHTGRTHQIRVHMQSINHSVVGDKTYGGSNKFKVPAHLLLAYKIKINEKVFGKEYEFTSKLPDYFTNVLEKLDKTLLN